MKDNHAALVERLCALRREIEVRFTGAFADNLVNALDAATPRLTEAEAEIARLKGALEVIECGRRIDREPIHSDANCLCTGCAMTLGDARFVARRALIEGNQSHE